MENTKPIRVLVIRPFRTDFSYSRYGLVSGFVSHQSDARPWDTAMFGDDAKSIEFNAQCSGDCTSGWYGFDISWENHSRLTVYECEKAVKTMKPIERKLHKLYQTYGNPKTIGEFAVRLAVALGCKQIIVHNRPECVARSGEEWRKYHNHSQFGLAMSEIDRQADECMANVRGEVAIAA